MVAARPGCGLRLRRVGSAQAPGQIAPAYIRGHRKEARREMRFFEGHAVVQIPLNGAPSTAVMTTNITRFTMDVDGVVLGRDPGDVARARGRAKHTLPAILRFGGGRGLGPSCEAASRSWASALPAGLALLALAMGCSAGLAGAGRG